MNTSHPFSKTTLSSLLKWLVWLLAVAFLFYDFLLRVFPSVMIDPIMKVYAIDAASVGLVIGIYFYIYAPMQLPVGILMDRFGAHYLLAFATFICGISTLFFAFAPNVATLTITRLLTGFGSSFAFVGVLYLTSHWFPLKLRALLIGIANSAAMIGAAVGEGPLSLIETSLGWRLTVVILGAVGLLISVTIFLAVLNQPKSIRKKEPHSSSWSEAWKYLKLVLRHRLSWINASVGLLIYATTTGFAALWGVNFLQHIHGISLEAASFAISLIYIGWMIGGPLVGYLADRFSTRRPFLITCPLLAFFIMGLVIYLPGLHFTIVYIALFLVGFLSASELLCFSYAIELFHKKATASSAAFTNFIVSLGGAFFQPFVGWMLVLFWTGDYIDGIKAYSVGDYQLAMSCFPLSFLAASLLALFLKENLKSPKSS